MPKQRKNALSFRMAIDLMTGSLSMRPVKAHSSHHKFLNLIWVTDQENSLISSINHLKRVCTVLINTSVWLGRLTEEAIIAERTGLCRESAAA